MLAACLDAAETTALDTKKLNTSIDQLMKARSVITRLVHGLALSSLGWYIRMCLLFSGTRQSFFFVFTSVITPFRGFRWKVGDQNDY